MRREGFPFTLCGKVAPGGRAKGSGSPALPTDFSFLMDRITEASGPDPGLFR